MFRSTWLRHALKQMKEYPCRKKGYKGLCTLEPEAAFKSSKLALVFKPLMPHGELITNFMELYCSILC